LAIQVKEPWPNCVTLTGDTNAAARAYYQQHNIPAADVVESGGRLL
jgi:hypothetical protein